MEPRRRAGLVSRGACSGGFLLFRVIFLFTRQVANRPGSALHVTYCTLGMYLIPAGVSVHMLTFMSAFSHCHPLILMLPVEYPYHCPSPLPPLVRAAPRHRHRRRDRGRLHTACMFVTSAHMYLTVEWYNNLQPYLTVL